MDLSKILDVTPEPVLKVPEAFLGSVKTYDDPDYEYCLPAPMADFQKELTDAIVSLHYSDILKYFETNNKNDSLLIDSLKKLFLNAQLITSHPYLLIDHFMPKSLGAKDIPLKLIQTSGKFKVLKAVLDVYSGVQEFHRFLKIELHKQQRNIKKPTKPDKLDDPNAALIFKKHNQQVVSTVKKKLLSEVVVPGKKNILIVAREGKTLDLLESLLVGLKLGYVRYSGSYIKPSNKEKRNNGENVEFRKKVGAISLNTTINLENYLSTPHFTVSPIFNVKVHLISSSDLADYDGTGLRIFMKNFQDKSFKLDLLIPFDLSVNASSRTFQQIRNKNFPRKLGKTPTLRLVPIFTVDHIALNFNYQNGDDINENFRNTISAVVVERGKVGMIDPNLKAMLVNYLEPLRDWFLYSTEEHRPKYITNNIFWSIPPMINIPAYTPQDVEKSLLTEVKYVQEDDYSEFDDENEHKKLQEDEEKLEFEDTETFKTLYLKTPSDYFYETKRLNSKYMLNPIHLQNRSNIIGIESDVVTSDHHTESRLAQESVLTHFKIYEMNLKYFNHENTEDDLNISKDLNRKHREDFEANLDELSKFLAVNQKLRDHYKIVNDKKNLLQKSIELNNVKKLEEFFANKYISNDIFKGKGEARVEFYKEWRRNQLKIIELLEEQIKQQKSLALKENELSYLENELIKLDKLYEENVNLIAMKAKNLKEKLEPDLHEFIKKYNEVEDEEYVMNKRRKMNDVISEVDGLLLGLRNELVNNEDLVVNKNRNRYRRK